MGVEENQSVCTPSSAAKRKRKMGGDSDDDDDDDDDSDDQPEDEEEEEEEEMKKVKKVEIPVNDEVMLFPSLHILSNLTLKLFSWIYMIFASFHQDEVDQATSIEELEKQIEKLAKVCFISKYIRLMYSKINNIMSACLGEYDNG